MHTLRLQCEKKEPCPHHSKSYCKDCSLVGVRACATSSLGQPSAYLVSWLHSFRMLHLYRAEALDSSTRKLSDILLENRILGLELVKTDVEGRDYDIIRDLMQNYFSALGVVSLPRVIIFEGHQRSWAEANLVLSQLQSFYGYRVEKDIPQALRVTSSNFSGEGSVKDVVAVLSDVQTLTQKRVRAWIQEML